MKIRVLIVDDEPPARQLLSRLMQNEPDVEIVGACDNGVDALRQIKQRTPDVVFLDIQMPQLDGLEVASLRHDGPRPLFVFVTAHATYAVPAFELQAFDYILKPFEYDRVKMTLERVRQRRAEVTAQNPSLSPAPSGQASWDRLTVKSEGKISFIKPDDVTLIEAEGNYVRLHTTTETFLHRERLNRLEAALQGRNFVRVSRSAIVNLEHVKEWRPLFHGDSVLVLTNGRRVDSSRTHRQALEKYLRGSQPLAE